MATTKNQQNREMALKILDENPDGLQYMQLIHKISEAIPSMKVNTIHGSVWDLEKQFPEKVYKPAKGKFRLVKYQESIPAGSSGSSTNISPTPSIKEEEFYQPFADWLVNEVEECTKAIALGRNIFKDKWQTPDVIGKMEPSRSDIIKFDIEIISAEIKLDSNSSVIAFGQACSYKLFSHKSWLVVPKNSGDEDIAKLDSLCRIFGIGLVLFDSLNPENPDFKIQSRPQRSIPDMFYVNKYMKLIESKLFQG
jgi:hypothetical protein